MSDSPLVTCWCATRNRRAWLPAAIRCFQEQDYPNRELLIVADGEDVRDLIPQDDRRIRLAILGERERPAILPFKFNLCCNMAGGEILCKWDDDDWYFPGRISEQVALLQRTGLSVTGYNLILFTDGRDWYRYLDLNWCAGTSLCFKRTWWEKHPFRPEKQPGGVLQQTGSDGGFAREAQRHRQIVLLAAENRIVASVHSGNTCQRVIRLGSSWKKYEAAPQIPGYEWPLGQRRAA